MDLRSEILDAADALRDGLAQIIAAPGGSIAKRDATEGVLKQFRDHCAELLRDMTVDAAAYVAKQIGNFPFNQPANDDDEKHMDKEVHKVDNAAEVQKAVAEGRAVPGVSPQQIAVMKKEVGHDMLMAKAHEYRKAHPELSVEQAYEKVMVDPANAAAASAALTKAIPSAIGDGIPFMSAAEAGDRYIREGTQNAAPVFDPHVKLLGLADERRARQPHLTREQAYAAVMQDPANYELAAAALGRGGVRIVG